MGSFQKAPDQKSTASVAAGAALDAGSTLFGAAPVTSRVSAYDPHLSEEALRDAIQRLQSSEERERAAAQRMATLRQATADVAAALSARDVADVLLSVAERVLGAAAGVVYFTREDEKSLYLEAARGVPSAVRLSVLTEEVPLPLARIIKERLPAWFESYDELVRAYPNVASSPTPTERLQATVAMPMIHGQRLVGGFALSFSEPRVFDSDDRSWLESFASECALAAERARLYRAEREARTEAETLLRISESLNETKLDLEALVQRVTDEATHLVGANFGAFFYNVDNEAGESYLLYALTGAPKQAFAEFGLPRNTPMFASTFAGKGVVRLDDVRKDPRYGKLGPHYGMPTAHLPVVSYLAVPVVSRSGEVLGGLSFGHSDSGRFTAQHERMVSALAAHAATAIDNAHLYRATRTAERKQRRLVDELTETVRLNEMLARVLAHDLRNPLSSIVSSAELALIQRDHGNSDKLEQPLRRIITSGARMSRMVEQLLDFARMRAGAGLQLSAKPLNLRDLLERIVEELESIHADVTFELEGASEARGSWDEDRLSQAFSNLLGNAVQHGIRQHGVRIRLDDSDPKTVSVAIHNRGSIPIDALGDLFKPLTLRERPGEGQSGLGLGLFITREIARAHGGSVKVQSTEESGTWFTVQLPREPLAARGGASPNPAKPSKEHPHSMLRPVDGAERFGGNAQKFRLLVESVKDYAIFMLDPTGLVATWNSGAERIKGYTAREIIGQHFSRFYQESEARSGFCERALEIARTEGRFETEGYRVRKDGSTFWAHVVLTALFRPNGELVGFAKVTRDLTERKKLEEERLKRAQAEEAVRLRDEFLSIVSHEFKTPLGVLQLQIESLTKHSQDLDPIFMKNVQRAKRSGDQLLRLVDSVLEVTRIATGTFALVRERFDLAEAVRDAVSTVQPTAELAGCDLHVNLDANLVGSWDRRRIQQVVTHLLQNAMTYAAGAPIHVRLERRSHEARLEIADSGPGIAEADLQRIFGRFERASSMRHYSGLGLGLYIAREVALAHGGTVVVESVPGAGARFELRLPFEARSG